MMMMLIGLDEKRIDADGYEIRPFWDWIDGVFEHVKWTKEPQDDGTVLYISGKFNSKLRADCFSVMYLLSNKTDFMEYCTKWIGFDNNHNESAPFIQEDLLN